MKTSLGWTAEGCNQRVSILASKTQWQPMTRSSTQWLLTIRWPDDQWIGIWNSSRLLSPDLCIHPGCLHPSWYLDIAILTRRTPFLLNWSFGPRRPWSEVPLESLGSGGDEPVILNWWWWWRFWPCYFTVCYCDICYFAFYYFAICYFAILRPQDPYWVDLMHQVR